MHSEMGPVRQNPIQRTVRTAHLSVLMTVQLQYTIQHRTVLIISPVTSPDKHHSSDAVYWRGGVSPVSWTQIVQHKWELNLGHADNLFQQSMHVLSHRDNPKCFFIISSN